MSYAHSHLYPGADMIALLTVATSLFSPPLDVLYFVWFMFVIGFSLLFVPFLYNPNTLQLATLRRDWRLWAEWVSAEHSAAAGGAGAGAGPGASWRAWWERGTKGSAAYDEAALISSLFFAAVYGFLAGCIFDEQSFLFKAGGKHHTTAEAVIDGLAGASCLSLLLPPLALALFDSCARGGTARRRRPWLVGGLALFGVAWAPAVWALGYYWPGHHVARTGIPELGFVLASIGSALHALLTQSLGVGFAAACAAHLLCVADRHLPPARALLRLLHRARDYLLAFLLCLPLLGLALLCCARVQHRIIFQPSQFFFRGGPRSACRCCAYFALFAVLLAAYFAWTTLWALGYLPALGIVGVVEMLLPGSHMVSVDYR
jgi:hypothetical protein